MITVSLRASSQLRRPSKHRDLQNRLHARFEHREQLLARVIMPRRARPSRIEQGDGGEEDGGETEGARPSLSEVSNSDIYSIFHQAPPSKPQQFKLKFSDPDIACNI